MLAERAAETESDPRHPRKIRVLRRQPAQGSDDMVDRRDVLSGVLDRLPENAELTAAARVGGRQRRQRHLGEGVVKLQRALVLDPADRTRAFEAVEHHKGALRLARPSPGVEDAMAAPMERRHRWSGFGDGLGTGGSSARPELRRIGVGFDLVCASTNHRLEPHPGLAIATKDPAAMRELHDGPGALLHHNSFAPSCSAIVTVPIAEPTRNRSTSPSSGTAVRAPPAGARAAVDLVAPG